MTDRRPDGAAVWLRRNAAAFLTVAAVVVLSAYALAHGAESAAPGGVGDESARAAPQEALDFEFYRDNVEPIFTRPRPGYVPGRTACVNCHTWQTTTPLKLEPLREEGGRVFWTEEQSRRNFQVVARLVVPGDPDASRLLRKPLAADAGGAGSNHTGGTFWESKDDPEWQVMAEWVRAAPSVAMDAEPAPAPDFEFFRSCVQPIFVNPIENAIACTECHAGTGTRSFANPIPEGRDSWSEEESRQSYEALLNLIEPGHPEYSRFLHHPLHPEAGGDFMHNGGRRWLSKDDPEWQALAQWIRGDATGSTCPLALRF